MKEARYEIVDMTDYNHAKQVALIYNQKGRKDYTNINTGHAGMETLNFPFTLLCIFHIFCNEHLWVVT